MSAFVSDFGLFLNGLQVHLETFLNCLLVVFPVSKLHNSQNNVTLQNYIPLPKIPSGMHSTLMWTTDSKMPVYIIILASEGLY